MGVALGHGLFLSIAGLNFTVISEDAPLYEDSDRILSRFRTTQDAAAVPVTVRNAALPPREASEIFAAGSYSVSRSGDDRIVRFNAPAQGEALWSAVISPGRRRVDVAAGPGLRRRVAGAEVLENPFRYPLDQLALMYLLQGEGLVVHAAGAVIEGRAWLLAGVSGAGKTTLARLLAEEQGADLLSDDRIVVRSSASGFEAWGTPWPGEADMAVNRAAPLGGILYLVQDSKTEVRTLGAAEGVRRLAPLMSVPWYDREHLGSRLDFVDRLAGKTRFAELRFRPAAGDAAVIARKCREG